MDDWKTIVSFWILLGRPIFRCYVSFRECNVYPLQLPTAVSVPSPCELTGLGEGPIAGRKALTKKVEKGLLQNGD